MTDILKGLDLRPKRYYMCKSRMSLWVSLMKIQDEIVTNKRISRDQEKDLMRRFPENTNGCRCRDCRYHRLYKKLGGSK